MRKVNMRQWGGESSRWERREGERTPMPMIRIQNEMA